MEALEPFGSLLVALGAGFLIGLERERGAPQPEGSGSSVGPGGARTYPLFALGGALSTLLSRSVGEWIIAATFAALSLFLVVAYVDDLRHQRDRGLTSEAALAISFLLGCLALLDGYPGTLAQRQILVGAMAVVVTLLLSSKRALHGLARKLSHEDVNTTLKFLVVAIIVLPLLPDHAYGPLDAFNPFGIGLMIALIAGIGFVGYVAVRLMGPHRGLGVTGLVGGLVSSTAVTLSLSGRARSQPDLRRACALAVLAASAIMFVRILVEVWIVHAALLTRLVPPIGAMALCTITASGILYVRYREEAARARDRLDALQLANPFELGSAVRFGLIYAAVIVAAKAAALYFGSAGVYITSALAGLTDVDAVTLSLSQLSKDKLDAAIATTGITVGAAANTMVKAAMALIVGGWQYARAPVVAFTLTAVIGLFVAYVVA